MLIEDNSEREYGRVWGHYEAVWDLGCGGGNMDLYMC